MCDYLSTVQENGKTNFKNTTWQYLSDNILSDPLKTPRVCQSKFSNMKKDFFQVRFLRQCAVFGWDDDKCLPIADDIVWEETEKVRPEMIKWRTKPFPLFDNMLEALGEVSKYSFGDIDVDEIESGSGESSEDMNTSNAPGPEERDESHTLELLHRESAGAQSQLGHRRKKGPGVGASNDDLSSGLLKIAKAIKEGPGKDTVDSSLEGQAQSRIQDEACLTVDGVLVMLDLLEDKATARTYLGIKKDELRVNWLKKQLEKKGYSPKEHFIDLEG